MGIRVGWRANIGWIRPVAHQEVTILNHWSVVKRLLQLHRCHLEWGFGGTGYVRFHLSVRDYILVLIIVL